MVVLIIDDNLPPLQWKLVVIIDTFPGLDGLLRVVAVKTGLNYFTAQIGWAVPGVPR